MIIEGLKLMVIGMVIVYVFLITLMLLVILTSKLFKGQPAASPPRPSKRSDGSELIAVISAAIAAYRARKE